MFVSRGLLFICWAAGSTRFILVGVHIFEHSFIILVWTACVLILFISVWGSGSVCVDCRVRQTDRHLMQTNTHTPYKIYRPLHSTNRRKPYTQARITHYEPHIHTQLQAIVYTNKLAYRIQSELSTNKHNFHTLSHI